ncbi:MAG TPA: NERD domain-containing protein [Syntrophorhabdus sp.]|nr:NERD domain-containing protein [Syntrophorhabdus sp.]
MAIMHPTQIPEAYHAYSEVKFFNACKEQLSEKYHVFYSVRWYSSINGVREDSECDFLIFNPDYGFICVEVKGGTGIRVEDGVWYLIDHDDERKLKRSPYDQAEQSMRFFKKYYEDEMETQFHGVYGCAVAYPNYFINKPIAISSPMETTIDLTAMSDLQKRVTEIFRYFSSQWRKGSSFLSPDSQRKFISVINKRIALSISAGALIQDKERELLEINRTQDTVIDLLSHYPKAFIVGGAGTGKTWIGIKKIIRCVQGGGKALYLCYNKALAETVKEFTDVRADCYNIDAFAYSVLKDKALSAPEHEGCKNYSSLISDVSNLTKYDLVVIDEGQDFTEDWAFMANLLLKDSGSLYVFYDENQNIFRRNFGEKFFIDNPPFVLRYNIRNTANIYRYTQEHTNLGLDTIANQIEGVEPDYRSFSRKQQAIAFVDSVINKLVNKEGVLPQKIVILSNRRKDNSILNETSIVGSHPVSEVKYSQNSNIIAFRTVQGFKGLESDVVIYINHTYKNAPKTESDRATLYTAQTRARFYLYVIDFIESERI